VRKQVVVPVDQTRMEPAPTATTAGFEEPIVSEDDGSPIHHVPTLDPDSEWGRSAVVDEDSQRGHDRAPPTAATRARARSTSSIAGGVAAGLLVVLVPMFALRWSDDGGDDAPIAPSPVVIDRAPIPDFQPPTPTTTTTVPDPPIPDPPPTTTTTTTTTSRRPLPPPRSVVVAGAPDEVVWRAGGRVLGSGRAALLVPASVTHLDGEYGGGHIRVPIKEGLAWGTLPQCTLSVRGHEGRVRIGKDTWDVPARLRVVAGRYLVRHTADDGKVTTYNVDATPGQAVLTLKSAP
jgi:hypothetical protein